MGLWGYGVPVGVAYLPAAALSAEDVGLLNCGCPLHALMMQVPTGCHWREWYFERLGQACILIYILSNNALMSEYCCDELYFARDNNLAIVPVLYNLDQINNLEAEIKAGDHPAFAKKYPAIKSVLNRCNRLPQNGAFEVPHAWGIWEIWA